MRRLIWLAPVLAAVAVGCGARANLCGNGKVDPGETCDGENLSSQTCESIGFGAGTLKCTATCELDRSSCAAPASCGNGVRDGVEICDGTDLAGASCNSVGAGAGTLHCAPNCGGYSSTECSQPPAGCVPQCGTRTCGNDPVCNKPCGTCDDQSVCSASGQCQKICDLPALTESQALNFDVKTLTVTTRVTLDGKEVPDNVYTASRGSIVFFNKSSSARTAVPLGAKGSGPLTTVLYPGSYDVLIEPGPATEQNVFPSYPYRALAELELTQSRTLEVALRTVTVTGSIKLNGGDPPNSGGNLRFRPDGSAGKTVALGSTGFSNFSVKLFAGRYDVVLEPASESSAFPAYNHLLSAAEEFAQDSNRVFDVKTVQVNGVLTRNAAALPSASASPGSIRFFDATTGAVREAPLSPTGAYSIKLYSGTYDIALKPNTNSFVFPRSQHTLEQGAQLLSDTSRNFDVKTVRVTLSVLMDGKPLPSVNGKSDGTLIVRNSQSGESETVVLGVGGQAYPLELFAGPYDVVLRPEKSGWLPALSKQIVTAEPFLKDTTRTFELETIRANLALTLNGAPMPSSPSMELRVFDPKTLTYVPITLNFPGPFNPYLWKGQYALVLAPTTSNAAFPSYSERIAQGLSITDATLKTVDVKVIDVQGTVTLNGALLPDNRYSGSRGSLRFVSRSLGGSVQADVGRVGEGRYFSVRLYAGTFDVDLEPQAATAQSVWPEQRTRLRTGCFARGACQSSKDNLAGTWQVVTSSLWGNWRFELGQSGTRLGGTYSYPQLSGPLVGGEVKGDSVRLIAQPWSCTVTFDGKVLDGCTLTGTLNPTGICGGWPAVPFFGQRFD